MDAETRVDVLAVLDRQLGFTIASDYPGASDDHRDLVAARDAVAELIRASSRIERKAIQKAKLTSSVFTADVDKLRAALSAIRSTL